MLKWQPKVYLIGVYGAFNELNQTEETEQNNHTSSEKIKAKETLRIYRTEMLNDPSPDEELYEPRTEQTET